MGPCWLLFTCSLPLRFGQKPKALEKDIQVCTSGLHNMITSSTDEGSVAVEAPKQLNDLSTHAELTCGSSWPRHYLDGRTRSFGSSALRPFDTAPH